MKRKHRSKRRSEAVAAGTPEPPRSEAAIWEELRQLCQSPGFIHALAALVFSSNVITATEAFTKEDFLKIYRPERLIRTETNLLTGLMMSANVDASQPSATVLNEYVARAIALLEELHQSIILPGRDIFLAALGQMNAGQEEVANPLTSGVMIREAIFYGGESAFPFQYEDLAKQRYASDREWMVEKLGFDIDQAAAVMSAIRSILQNKLSGHFEVLRGSSPEDWTMLPLFNFSAAEVYDKVALPAKTVDVILDAFAVRECDSELSRLQGVGDYNRAASQPIVRLHDGTTFCFLEYGAFSALYDNPFYWIVQDKEYLGKHSQSRGSFVELFTEETLCRVFPPQYVFKNVVFRSPAGDVVGEADTILLYGFRAFIVQAKSKRLTLASWHGDDAAIASDFKMAVQEAYDQAIECVRHIKNGVQAFVDDEPVDLQKYGKIEEFYPVCITSEHYPALSFQSSIFLKLAHETNVHFPLVMDVFTLDVIAEMLDNPLYFTDYLVKRSAAADRVSASHELIVLAWYIKRNLYLEKHEFITLADDIMVELDLAMAVRRAGIEGPRTPEGQLTRYDGTEAGTILAFVKESDRPEVHRIGEIILGMNGETADTLNEGIRRIVQLTLADFGQHDVTIALKGGGGITIHCSQRPVEEATRKLAGHCAMRKYVQRADRWYGVLIGTNGIPKAVAGLEAPWTFDPKLEAEAAPFRIRNVTHSLTGPKKIGRNDACPCGSGKKYKKCHGAQ